MEIELARATAPADSPNYTGFAGCEGRPSERRAIPFTGNVNRRQDYTTSQIFWKFGLFVPEGVESMEWESGRCSSFMRQGKTNITGEHNIKMQGQ